MVPMLMPNAPSGMTSATQPAGSILVLLISGAQITITLPTQEGNDVQIDEIPQLIYHLVVGQITSLLSIKLLYAPFPYSNRFL